MDGSRRRGPQLVGYVKREWAKGAFSELEDSLSPLTQALLTFLARLRIFLPGGTKSH